MTRRRDVERELAALTDIRSILDAMRNLALLETRKIERFLHAHERALQTTADALGALAGFSAAAQPRAATRPVLVVLGSERGLCGDFNEALLRALKDGAAAGRPRAALVAVGARLASRLERDAGLLLAQPGPGIAEDVDAVVAQLARSLADLLRGAPLAGFELEVLFHPARSQSVQRARLRAVPDDRAAGPPRHPPRVNLAPALLLEELSERYLVLQLQGLLYGSLLAENEQRLRHMDAAIRKLDETFAALHVRRNRLRQEEITEEIEIIMLSAAGVLR